MIGCSSKSNDFLPNKGAALEIHLKSVHIIFKDYLYTKVYSKILCEPQLKVQLKRTFIKFSMYILHNGLKKYSFTSGLKVSV
jgi:hypothetical protein